MKTNKKGFYECSGICKECLGKGFITNESHGKKIAIEKQGNKFIAIDHNGQDVTCKTCKGTGIDQNKYITITKKR